MSTQDPTNSPQDSPANEVKSVENPGATDENPIAGTSVDETASSVAGESVESSTTGTDPTQTASDSEPTPTATETLPATADVEVSAVASVTAAKIAIGSQRDAADKTLAPSKPKAVQNAEANRIKLGKSDEEPEIVIAPIKSEIGLGEDLDAEIAAALGEISMDDVVAGTEASEKEIEPNTRTKAAVTKIHEDNVFVKLTNQYEGVAALHHFKEPPKEGDLVEIIVRSLNKEDGLYELSVPGAAVGVADWEDIEEGSVIEARVTGSNTGGLEVMVNSIRGFIPASQIDRFRVEDFSQFINQKYQCVVMEVKPEKKKLVLSRRAVLDREAEVQRKKLLEELEAGQIREGIVTKLMDFGAFVDLGGVEGLIHVSKVSWNRVKHPSEVLSVGEKVRVKVEKIYEDSNRISLSHKDTLEHPWENLPNELAVNQVVKGTVTKIADFGCFVKLSPGIEGLVHISELAHRRVARVSSVVQAGQEIDVKILSMDKGKQKISLSHKACLSAPAPKQNSKKEEVDELPARDLVVQARDEPLKGGTDRKSGGEEFGLKW
ncbi:MAG: S1 RNA-binding domain-containing protein [Planctomycetota bacterium]